MRRFITGWAVLALVIAGAGCGSSGGGPGTAGGADQVKVGTIPIVDIAPLYLGRKQGFFSRRRIELTMQSGQGGAAIVPGVVSGQFQIGFSNMTTLLIAQTRNVPIRVIVNGVASTGRSGRDYSGVTVTRDSPITGPADLAGKTVAVNTLKNIGDTTVRASVRKAGGDPGTVRFVEMPFSAMPAAVAAGQVDAAWVVEPFLSAVTAAGGRVVAWNYVDAAPDLTVAGYFASTRLIGQNPDLVRRFTEAMNESLAYADAHPEEVRAVLGEFTRIDPGTRASLTLPKWPTAINEPSVETLSRLGAQDGIFGGATPDLTRILP